MKQRKESGGGEPWPGNGALGPGLSSPEDLQREGASWQGNLHSSPLWMCKGNGERTKASRLLALAAWRWVEGALSSRVLPERLRHCVRSFPTGSVAGKAAQRRRWADNWRWGRARCRSEHWSLGGSSRLPTGSKWLRAWPALFFSCKDRFRGGRDQGGCGGSS